MSKLHFWLVRVLLACILVPQLSYAVQLSGHVTGASSGQPLPGASLSFQQGFNPPTFTAVTTSDNGGYYQQDVPSGYVTITVSATAYTTYSETISIGSAPMSVDFSLGLAGSISGTVRATASGAVLSNERVVLLSNLDQRGEALTAVDGTFVFSGLSPDQYAVCVMDAGDIYLDVCYDGHLVPTDGPLQYSDVTPIDIAPGQDRTGIDFALPVSTYISGTLRDSYFNMPIAGVPIEFTRYSPNGTVVARSTITTGADGTYLLRSLIAGSYYLQAGSPVNPATNTAYTSRLYGGGECLPTCNLASGTLIAVSDSGVANVDFELFPGFIVTGSVTDAVSGLGIANVTINACNGFAFPNTGIMATAVTDSAGNYLIAHVPGNGKVATIDAPAHINVVWPGDTIRPMDSCLSVGGSMLHFTSSHQVLTDVNFNLQRGPAISGRVSARGAPSIPAPSNVALYRFYNSAAFWTSTVKTDADGNYTTVGVDPGVYFVAAFYSDFSDCQFYADAACSQTVWYYGNPYPPNYADPTQISLSGTSVVSGVSLQLDVRIFANGFE